MALDKAFERAADRVTARPRRRAQSRTLAERPAWRSQFLLTVVLLIFLAPFALMVLTALKPADQVFTTPPRPFGRAIEWHNFAQAWNYLPFGRFMINGIIVSVLGTAVVLVASILAAYAFARLRFRGRDKIFLAYLGTLMVPQEVLVVPMFVLMQKFGWVNSYQGLVLPWAFTAFGTFLLRQFFLTIPWELEEAAVIDGARKLTVLLRVLLPIARPAVAVLAVFTFINYWNSFLWPLIIVNTSNMATVPLGLDMFLGQHGNQWHLLMAASTISVVPSLIMVVVLQRYLVRGIALAGFAGR
jgi:multiple sugar transport system permease protein